MLLEAIRSVSAEQQPKVASAGLSVALGPLSFAVAGTTLSLLLNAWVMAFTSLIDNKQGARADAQLITFGRSRPSLYRRLPLLGAAATLLALAWVGSALPILSIVLALAVPPLMMSSLEKDMLDEITQQRRATYRIGVAVSAVGSVGAVIVLHWLFGTIELHHAYAYFSSSPELQRDVFLGGVKAQQSASLVALPVLGGVMLWAALTLSRALGSTPHSFSAPAALTLGVVLFIGAGLSVGIWSHHKQLRSMWPAYTLWGIQRGGLKLPEGLTHTGARPPASPPSHAGEIFLRSAESWFIRGPEGQLRVASLPLPEAERAPTEILELI